jgi:crotonobetainyl-CoA:carnitine CoA-transferase CaiB-like acyl-CoA transferase
VPARTPGTSGRGQVIDVALYEAVFNCMESLLPEYSAFGAVRGPAGSALPGIAPSNAYRCATATPWWPATATASSSA